MLSSENQATHAPIWFKVPTEMLGNLDTEFVARAIAVSNDIAMVIDREGIIRNVAVSGTDLPLEGFANLVERKWVDTVTIDSRNKVEEMLRDASNRRNSRWREVNQTYARGSLPLRCLTMDTGANGNVIAFARDMRNVEVLQQRLLQAQQAMERDYVRLRQAESRYRVLFQIASEAVLIIDQSSKKIIEANPAAGALLGVDYNGLLGQPFAKLFHAESRDTAMALLIDTNPAIQAEPARVRLADGREGFSASASLFRQDGATHVLISLAHAKTEAPPAADEENLRLLRILNRIPDAFVVTDEALNILSVNLAFLELSQLASAEAARDLPLSRFIGRPGVDLRVLMGNLREYGWVRNFQTIVRTGYGGQEEVELSAVSVRTGLETTHAFTIRAARRSTPIATSQLNELPRTADQLRQLVGRVSLREIVAETTDVIERMCIEAALNLTGNNRASAAEVLGLSRQSLYSKLNRHGVGQPEPEPSTEQ